MPVGLPGLKSARGSETQKALAKRLGITDNYISLLENGERDPSMTLALKISEAVGKSVNYLLVGPGTEEEACSDV